MNMIRWAMPRWDHVRGRMPRYMSMLALALLAFCCTPAVSAGHRPDGVFVNARFAETAQSGPAGADSSRQEGISNIGLSKPLRHFTTGLGLAAQVVNDEGAGPLTYRGPAFALCLGYIKEKRSRSVSVLEFAAGLGTIRASNEGNLIRSAGNLWRLDVDYAYLRRLQSDGIHPWELMLGGAYLFNGVVRYQPHLDNSAISYDVTNALGPSGMIRRRFFLRDQNMLSLSLRVDLPLIAHVIRPPYQNRIDFINPDTDILSEAFRRSAFATLNRYQALRTDIEAGWAFANGNRIRLEYTWDFYRSTRDPHTVVSAQHALLFSTLFLF